MKINLLIPELVRGPWLTGGLSGVWTALLEPLDLSTEKTSKMQKVPQTYIFCIFEFYPRILGRAILGKFW